MKYGFWICGILAVCCAIVSFITGDIHYVLLAAACLILSNQ